MLMLHHVNFFFTSCFLLEDFLFVHIFPVLFCCLCFILLYWLVVCFISCLFHFNKLFQKNRKKKQDEILQKGNIILVLTESECDFFVSWEGEYWMNFHWYCRIVGDICCFILLSFISMFWLSVGILFGCIVSLLSF